MVLTESLAHGIPVVTTNSGNIPDTVPQAMGVFTEPGNLESLVSALKLLFTNSQQYKSLCIAASGYYRQATTWQTSLDKLERLITVIQDKNGK
jgi:glycosyltransferase involved in cell wall biosynthesis